MASEYHYNIINPSFDSLGYILAIANLEDKHDRSAPSHYHWKILKCRMIIFSNSSILACPDKMDTKRVHVIFSKVGNEYDKLNSFFKKFSLKQEGEIKKVNPDLFQMCFQYTLTAKLAPAYNTIGDHFLIRNRYFLTTKGHQQGLKFNIWSNETATTMEIQPVKITLIRPDNFCKPGEWVRVLPSLNKAIIEDYYEHLPENGTFKYYKDLRRHWKNIDSFFELIVQHGYRLPEEECQYYAVRFWRGDPLTYPKICVLQNYPIVTPVPKATERTELMKFVSCLKQKMPYILSLPLTIKHIDHNFQDVSYEKPQETQLLSLCTPTQNIKPKTSSGHK